MGGGDGGAFVSFECTEIIRCRVKAVFSSFRDK